MTDELKPHACFKQPGMLIALILALFTIVARAPDFGNPAYHIDEQFYLLVGRSMTHGALPYVDIWDRKPLGLFIIYALTSLLGGAGVMQYQAVAGLFVWATALTLAHIVRRFVRPLAAALTGMAYIAAMETMAGGGGQAPVFYNLFMALAFLLTLRACEASDARTFQRNALGAMALCSLALFVKETVVVEALCFGCMLLWKRWQRLQSYLTLLEDALLYALIGILPYALAALYYAALGHFQDFWFANFLSLLHKQPTSLAEIWPRLLNMLINLFPLILLTAFGAFTVLLNGTPPHKAFVKITLLWLGAAIGALWLVPNFYAHYALPLILPLTLLAAAIFDRLPLGPVYAALACAYSLMLSGYPHWHQTADAKAAFAHAATDIKTHLHGRCLYIYQGPSYLYDLSGACRLTRYAFSEHLSTVRESQSIGADPAAEVRRILAAKPNVIVTGALFMGNQFNPATANQVFPTLQRDFILIDSVRLPHQPPGDVGIQIWARKVV